MYGYNQGNNPNQMNPNMMYQQQQMGYQPAVGGYQQPYGGFQQPQMGGYQQPQVGGYQQPMGYQQQMGYQPQMQQIPNSMMMQHRCNPKSTLLLILPTYKTTSLNIIYPYSKLLIKIKLMLMLQL